MSHKPTPEQAAIIDAACTRRESIMVNAYAGCAKSSTLEMLAHAMPAQPVLSLAFNKKIAMELEKRLPPSFTVKTLNGLGHSAWSKAIGRRPELDDKKLGKLVTQVAKGVGFDLSSDQWDQVRTMVTRGQQAGVVPASFPHQGLTEDTIEAWKELADQHYGYDVIDENVLELSRMVLTESVKLAFKGVITFDDQIYMSTMFNGVFPRFPLVTVDEAQDLSPLNHIQVARCAADRLIVVGDRKQCHPPGTIIQLSGGKSKAIENVEIGDQIVSFNRKVGFAGVNTQGRKITDKQTFYFDGELVRINTDGPFTHECTPNHRCLARWTDKKGYAVYLMRKGNQYRIGTAQCWYNTADTGGFGPAMRARQEGADALWILKVLPDKEEALIEEKVLWTLFGLPDLIFRCSGKASSTQKHLDAAWEAIGDNSKRAKLCLKRFNRDHDFPFWTSESKIHVGEKTFITEACNLISGAMAVKIFDGSANCPTWLTCWIDYERYAGPVIGLTVESNGFGLNLYVANGIVTHNSIYAFRGADTSSMDKLRKLRSEWIDLPLATTFRCPKGVVARQQEHAPGFTAWSANAEGKVLTWNGAESPEWSWDRVQQALPAFGSEVAMLCRNNAPLLSMAFKLLRQGIACHMLGRDIGKGLVVLSKKIFPKDDLPIAECISAITLWMERESALARANGKDEKIEGLTDRGECLIAVAEGGMARNAGELREALGALFARESGKVTLSSIHRAKGLEWDLVIHLDPWRIPSKWARQAADQGQPAQLQQEMNLKYVGETRTKHTLVMANVQDFA
jgi:hypothetical protein